MKIIYYPRCSCGWKGTAWSDSKPGSLLAVLDFMKIVKPGTVLDRLQIHLTPTMMELIDEIEANHTGDDHHVKFVLDVPLTDSDVHRIHFNRNGRHS